MEFILALIYANTNWQNNRLTDSVFSSWPRWVAQYNYQCTYSGKYGMWQADGNTSIYGIAGGVDVNFDFAGPIRHKDIWVCSNGSWWYRYKNGSYPSNGWAYIDDAWYHFDSAGWMQTGSSKAFRTDSHHLAQWLRVGLTTELPGAFIAVLER